MASEAHMPTCERCGKPAASKEPGQGWRCFGCEAPAGRPWRGNVTVFNYVGPPSYRPFWLLVDEANITIARVDFSRAMADAAAASLNASFDNPLADAARSVEEVRRREHRRQVEHVKIRSQVNRRWRETVRLLRLGIACAIRAETAAVRDGALVYNSRHTHRLIDLAARIESGEVPDPIVWSLLAHVAPPVAAPLPWWCRIWPRRQPSKATLNRGPL